MSEDGTDSSSSATRRLRRAISSSLELDPPDGAVDAEEDGDMPGVEIEEGRDEEQVWSKRPA